MKRLFKISFTVSAAFLIAALSAINCFAKGELTLAEGVSAERGDTLTYTFYLADCESPVTDMVASLFYDSGYLELDKDSVDFHDLVGVNRNLDMKDCIPFTFTTISAPVDFSKRTPVVSVDFKVKKEGESAIKYFVTDLDCGSVTDSAPVKEFTFSCDYVVHSADGDKKIGNVTPVLQDDKEKIDNNQGDFVNYEDGKGEQDAAGKEHTAVTGEPKDVVDVTKGNSNGQNNTTIIITVAVIVIALVIGIILILRKVSSGDNSENEGNEEDSVEENEEAE